MTANEFKIWFEGFSNGACPEGGLTPFMWKALRKAVGEIESDPPPRYPIDYAVRGGSFLTPVDIAKGPTC
jgi:hypothetical protein